MKKIILILLLTAMQYSLMATHFVQTWVGNGPGQMNIYLISAALGTGNLQAGDEIAVFDGTVCSGILVVENTIDVNNIGSLIAIKADVGGDGFNNGKPMTFKYWDAKAQKEYSGVTAVFHDNDLNVIPAVNFLEGETAVVSLSAVKENSVPVANAGTDQTVNEGATVTLDGSASFDADGDALTYFWAAPPGVTLSDANAQKPTFTAPNVKADTNFVFILNVSDVSSVSVPDFVTITVKNVNLPPIANGGDDKTVNEGEFVTLYATASSDPDGDPLTYNWNIPAGITPTYTPDSKLSFLAPEVKADTVYTFSLVVNDGKLNSAADEVKVTVKQVNKVPVANAGPDQEVTELTTVTLDGSASTDGDGEALTYAWTAPVGITLSSTTAAKPTFMAPDVNRNTDYVFSLIVNDGKANSTADEVKVTVKKVNIKPIANAGPDQTVNENTQVELNGKGSSDADGDPLTYKWTAPTGITLSSLTVSEPTFTAPEVKKDTIFTLLLVVNDETDNSLADTVKITVKQVNVAPAANAGTDQTVNEGVVVTLDGSASSDFDSDALTYLWTAPAGVTLSSTTAQKPTFTAEEVMADKDLVFSLVVNDGKANSTADEVKITIKNVNKEPIGNAGLPQSVNEGAVVTLDGSASSDPDGDALTYLWTAPAGITLSSATAQKPTFTAPEVATNTDFTFTLVVNDGKLSSKAKEVKITVLQVNKVPVANAGTDQVVFMATTVTLDGSASSDGDNDALTYTWTAPAGITLSSTSAAKPTFTAPNVAQTTQYTFKLRVNDGKADSQEDQVVVSVRPTNKVPVANAGTNQTVNENTQVSLNGSASSDADNDPLTYLWTSPAGITLSSTTVANPTFYAPEVSIDTDYTFSLVVNDGFENSTASSVKVTVKHVNKVPVANAGPDQTVIEGSSVTLDGSASSDGDGDAISYSWTAPAGVTLSSTTAQKPTFTAPDVNQDTDYTFTLTVNDGTESSAADQVIITVKQQNQAPVANAGADQTVNELSAVTLDGSASTDPDGDAITYQWTAPAGIVLSSATAQKPTFTAPEVKKDTTFLFNLVVKDAVATSTSASVKITVKQVNKLPIANAGANKGGKEGTVITLDGSASSDPDGDVLTYAWTAPEGITLSSFADPKPSFTAPEVDANKELIFKLKVSDGKAESAEAQVVITVYDAAFLNVKPVANAGADQTVDEGSSVTLDGTASTDADGNTLTYKWSAPVGITLSSNTVSKPTFNAPEVSADTEYVFTLVVNDGFEDSNADEVKVTVKQVNKVPVANAGADQTVNEGAVVMLDGSASTDADGDAIKYQWTAPTGITLSATDAAKPTFTAPEVQKTTTFVFTLIVTDGKSNSVADEVVVTVKSENKAPVANAGADQSANEGAVVSLNGSASSDPDGDALTFQWTAPTGIVLNSTTEGKPTFTAPEVTEDKDFVFSLVVSDGTLSSTSDEVKVTIKNVNKVPVANAGANQTVNEGSAVSLDGSASTDGDGDALTYKWVAPAGILLNSTTDAKPTFTAPEVDKDTEYAISLIVNDGKTNSVASEVKVMIKQVNKVPEITSTPVLIAEAGYQYSYAIEVKDDDLLDKISFVIEGTPTWLTVTDNGNGTALLSGTPPTDATLFGDYTVTVKVIDGAIAEPITQVFTITLNWKNSIDQLEISDMEIYPNPASNYLNIELKAMPKQKTVMGLYNSKGQLAMQKVVGQRKTSFDVVNLPAGIYILKVSDQKSTISQKVIIRK